MHIPDGILSAPILATFGAASAATIAYSARKAEAATAPNRIPLLGVLGAFVFAAQMVNFPVGPGASGHLLGGALLAATIGPWAASITMTAILLIQALVFQDGGILALAANIFNMAVLGIWAAWLPLQFFREAGYPKLGILTGAFLSVLLSAVLALAQISSSSGIMTRNLWLLCLGLFSVTAAIEAVITLAACQAIQSLNGDSPSAASPARRPFLLLGAAVAVMLAGVFFASNSPDVLEFFNEQSGIRSAAQTFPSLLPDYEWKGLDREWLGKAAAGLIGLGLIFLVSLGISRFLPRQPQ
jgi:cobalt/nickel transport system permease protein